MPGIIVELKMNKTPETGLAQIKERGYASAFRGYRGPVYLVAVSCGSRADGHTCRIGKVEA